METRRRVTPLDVGRGMTSIIPDLPRIIANGPDLLLRRPSSRKSIGHVFEKLAAKQPEKTFLKAYDGRVTYGEANARVNRIAAALKDAGVQRGDVVGLMSHNSIEMILVLLATVKLGAISGLLNYNQREDVLAHSLGILGSRVLVLEEALREGFDTAGATATEQNVVTIDELLAAADGLPKNAEQNPPECAQTRSHEKAYYIFTSGTTGMPKASVMSHHRWLQSYAGLGGLGVRLRPDDTIYCCLPLYHNNAVTVALSSALNGGAAFAISRKFSVSNFWNDIIRYEATAFVYIGELCRYLLNQPVRDVEREHHVRVIVGNGLRQDIWHEFQERFGIERIAEFYGASECNIAFINAYNIDETAGVCPLPHRVVAYDPDTGEALRNAKGRLTKVKPGEAGLLLSKVTNSQPFDGYTDADATEKKLLRNGFRDGDCWFITGDLVTRQGMQHVAFVDRLGDTFRWKGENVATTQVEAAFERVKGVQDAVVYGIAVPGCDGKAGMASVVLRDGEECDPKEAAEELRRALPTYAVPLFVRIVDSLEQTSTFKARKVELREAGYSDDGETTVWVLGKDGYEPFYEDYPAEVAGTKRG